MKSVLHRIILSIVFAMATVVWAVAQLPQDFRTEQIALCLQRAECLPGDTVTVSGQVTCIAANRFLPYSKYLYLELINPSDSVVLRQKVKCSPEGSFCTAIAIDRHWANGEYRVRAYTRLMRNFSPESFAIEQLLVGKSYPEIARNSTEGVKCTIVPHGGHLHTGSLQSITVRVANALNHPLGGIPLSITTQEGDTVARHRTTPSGLALISFTPLEGKSYTLNVRAGKDKKQYPVPLCNDSTPSIQASLKDKKAAFIIEGINPNTHKLHLYAYDRMNGLMHSQLRHTAGSFMLNNMPQALTLFLTDDSCRILAQRTVTNRLEDVLKVVFPSVVGVNVPILIPKIDGATVHARLVPQRALALQAAESQINYLSDLSSPLSFPERFFTLSQRDRNAELMAWIGTTTFKRFALDKAVALDSAIYTLAPEEVMYFRGSVSTMSRQPFANGTLVAYNTSTDAAYYADIDSNGEFKIAVDDFTDGTQFFLQALNETNNPEAMVIKVADDTFPAVAIPPLYSPEITVKAHTQADVMRSTERFYGNSYKSREMIEASRHLTLLDILKDMAEIRIVKPQESGDYAVVPARSTASVGDSPMMILIDGQRTPLPLSSLMYMPAFEIESVEYLRPWEALTYTSGAPNGAINICTRSYHNMPKAKSKGSIYIPMGLTPSMEMPVLKADTPGNYRLIIDIIAPQGIHSYESVVKVLAK